MAIEFAMHEYGMDWDAAARMPLVRLFYCHTVASLRQNLKPAAPSFGEKAYLDGMAKGAPAGATGGSPQQAQMLIVKGGKGVACHAPTNVKRGNIRGRSHTR